MGRSGQLLRCLSGNASPAVPFQPRALNSFHLHAPPTQRQFHAAPPSLGKPKVKVRDTQPRGWQHSSDHGANAKAYNAAISEYKEKVGALRIAWRTRVAQHNRVLARQKEERDTKRLAEQREDLKRQLARWVAPDELRDLQKDVESLGREQESPDVSLGPVKVLTDKEREKAGRVETELREAEARRHARMAERYSRHAMTVHLAQVSRAAQAELLLRQSGQWISESDLDAAIERALDDPVDLFAAAEPWTRGLDGVPEYVEGFEGPHAEQGLPEHVKRRMRRNE